MRSRVALLLILVLAGFVFAATWDRCADRDSDCGPLCHAGCLDNCSTAPVTAGQPPIGTARIASLNPLAAADSPLLRADQPDFQPPRS